MITDDVMEIHFGLRLLARASDHAYCQIVSALTRPGNCDMFDVGQAITTKLPNTHP